MIGNRYDRLVVLKQLDTRESGNIVWRCLCDCGVETNVRAYSLKNGHTTSCGCKKSKVLPGNTYNGVTAKERFFDEELGLWKWLCVCACGAEFPVSAFNLGRSEFGTRSCGCSRRKNRTDEEREKSRTVLVEGNQISYETFRKRVLERDAHSCQVCRLTDVALEVHHLEPYKKHVSLRTTVSNGVTLCVGCHKAFHRTYGRVGFTPFDYYQFHADYQRSQSYSQLCGETQ